jgi:hypothetical protein
VRELAIAGFTKARSAQDVENEDFVRDRQRRPSTPAEGFETEKLVARVAAFLRLTAIGAQAGGP